MLAEADHLVVLANDLGRAFGEVEGEGGLVGAEVVNVENELLGEVLWGAPDDPAYAGIDLCYLLAYADGVRTGKGKAYQAIFVTGDVDGDDLFQTEVPF